MKSCYNNYIIHGLCKYACSHAEHQRELGAGGVTKSSQCFGKSCILDVLSVLIFVGMIVVVVVMFEAYK